MVSGVGWIKTGNRDGMERNPSSGTAPQAGKLLTATNVKKNVFLPISLKSIKVQFVVKLNTYPKGNNGATCKKFHCMAGFGH